MQNFSFFMPVSIAFVHGNSAVSFLNGKNGQCIERDVTLLFILIGCTPTNTFNVYMVFKGIHEKNVRHFFIGQRKLLLCSSKLFLL